MSICTCGKMPCECGGWGDDEPRPQWELGAASIGGQALFDHHEVGVDEPYSLPAGWEPFAYDPNNCRVLVRRLAQ